VPAREGGQPAHQGAETCEVREQDHDKGGGTQRYAQTCIVFLTGQRHQCTSPHAVQSRPLESLTPERDAGSRMYTEDPGFRPAPAPN